MRHNSHLGHVSPDEYETKYSKASCMSTKFWEDQHGVMYILDFIKNDVYSTYTIAGYF